jgi:glutathione S-transferase
MSGQGPYFGQLVWFKVFHSEQLPSAIERYSNEVKRVAFVIDTHLKRSGHKFLVGDKITYADLAFTTWWTTIFGFALPTWDYTTEYPVFAEWVKALIARPSVVKCLARPEFQKH